MLQPFPTAKIFKVSQGKAELFTTLPDTTYVWALAFDKTKTNLFAAVGPRARARLPRRTERASRR